MTTLVRSAFLDTRTGLSTDSTEMPRFTSMMSLKVEEELGIPFDKARLHGQSSQAHSLHIADGSRSRHEQRASYPLSSTRDNLTTASVPMVFESVL